MDDKLLDVGTVQKKQVLIWRIVSLILLIILITIVFLYAFGVGWKKRGYFESEITLWNENSPIQKKLFPYVRSIKDESTTKIK